MRRRQTDEDVKDRALAFSACFDATLAALRPIIEKTGPKDFEEWAKSRLRIRNKAASVVSLALNNIQLRYQKIKADTVAEGKQPRFLVLKYRQGGITTFEQAESYRMTVMNTNSYVVTLADTKEKAAAIFRMIKLMHTKDPCAPDIAGGLAHKLEVPGMNSLFQIGTAGASALGHGLTLQKVHWSEVSRSCKGRNQIEKQEEVMAGLTEAAGDYGEITCETTANGIEHFHNLFKDARKGLNEWTAIFLPWFIDRTLRDTIGRDMRAELHDTLSEDERSLMKRHGVDLPMIAWRRRKQRSLKRLFLEQYPEDEDSCFLYSGTPFFDVDVVLYLAEQITPYERKHVAGGYKVEWQAPKSGVKYVIGADTSEGLSGGDPNGLGVLRHDTGEQVFAMHGRFRPKVLAEHIVATAKRYNNALVGVERENTSGGTVIEAIENLGWRSRRRLYHFKKGRSGWSTNRASRQMMLDDLAAAMEEGLLDVHDSDMLSEMMVFRKQGSGRYEADSGCHDDCVFKWAIAWQMKKRRLAAPKVLLV